MNPDCQTNLRPHLKQGGGGPWQADFLTYKMDVAMNSRKGFIAMSAGMLSVLILGFHIYHLSMERSAREHRIELIEAEVRDFGILKTYLTDQVDSLQQAYEALALENKDILESSSAVTAQKLAEKAAIIKKLEKRETDSQNVSILKSKVDNLLKLKALLERDIADLSPAQALHQ